MGKYLNEFVLLIVAVIWGSGFIAAKHAINVGVTPIVMLGFRFLIAFIMLALIFWRVLIKSTKKDLVIGGLVGLMLFLAFAFQTYGIQYTSPAKNAFITGANVVIVPFLAWIFYKKRPENKAFYSAIICLTGIGLLTLNAKLIVNKGDVLTLICALFFAAHILLNGYFSKHTNTIRLAIFQMFFACVCSAVFMIFTRTGVSLDQLTMEGIASIVYLGVFSTGLAFLLQTHAQKQVNANKTAILLSMEAVFGMVFSVIFMNEIISVKILIGAALVLMAILINEVSFEKKSFT